MNCNEHHVYTTCLQSSVTPSRYTICWLIPQSYNDLPYSNRHVCCRYYYFYFFFLFTMASKEINFTALHIIRFEIKPSKTRLPFVFQTCFKHTVKIKWRFCLPTRWFNDFDHWFVFKDFDVHRYKRCIERRLTFLKQREGCFHHFIRVILYAFVSVGNISKRFIHLNVQLAFWTSSRLL